ncbi:hypothetical protein METBIDRAFT_32546 [Metschnikowia bicuspidata var. bicuspidata NRRL YB-4993]|uniref:VASt domain-containing protein n=1 Tax=Metschnikowia bicuspidata var. bicuspidata NRRL YB-4993 TaxID=869754 RepID=A0A1A0H8W6_9ASCO|nr:hypothetical protein METBIDRAFT_32546 [Metschnikowia bicuspidata var. bicuspidata NRRL YB-4993]OBA20564.1 hypothetical protein METBIDRAFT_32546 [Metschnikowia bicuspidata var. bicuspidata NRRL YB-4993]
MEDEDDNWSYSFPPSTEDLPSTVSKIRDIRDAYPIEINNGPIKFPAKDYDEVPIKRNLRLFESSGGQSTSPSETKNSDHDLDLNAEISTQNPHRDQTSSLFGVPHSSETALQDSLRITKTQLSIFNPGNKSRNNKQLSLVLQPAFMLKLAPADPHTTRKDASLIISKENASNALALGSEPSRSSSPSSSPVSKSEFEDSMKIWQQKNNEGDILLNSSDPGSTGEVIDSSSPKIITYRKTTHVRKTSNNLRVANQDEKFDSKLYVSEKYKNSCYHYATMKRNVEFHQLFKSIDLTNRLLDDFACAISREILLQGRLYITEHCLCFNSNLLGWVTSLVVPFSDITRIDKKSTAGLFPNGIIVETKSSKHTFASFLSRDSTFDFIRSIWLGSTGKDISDLDLQPMEAFSSDTNNLSERRISDYIMSIDEGDAIDDKWMGDQSEDSEAEHSDRNTDNLESDIADRACSNEATGTVPTRLRVMKPNSAYKNPGPDSHTATRITGNFEGADEETEILKQLIDAPLGAVFEILFGQENTKFHKHLLEDQGATNLSNYGKFEPMTTDPSKVERSYTYQRPLGYSIGPKATKCCVKEIIEYKNLSDSVVVLSITDTPDVPSGGSFSVMTRYYLTWGAQNSTDLKIAYTIKWSGRSWIKSMVEKLTQSAQVSVSNRLIELLKIETENQTQIADAPLALPLKQTLTSSSNDSLRVQEAEPSIKNEHFTQEPSKNQIYFMSLLFFFIIILLAFVILVCLNLLASISDIKVTLAKQLVLLKNLLDYAIRGECELLLNLSDSSVKKS